ncbi:MAG TPA: serine/threonine-protein kinase, partial [Pseudomonadota bacterium]|nr:serine/threonine-protein kinase [Pseudomonadota bacterium]
MHNCPLGGDASTAPASAADSDEMIGALLGDRYRIVSRLSRGGMGAIYKAEHVVLSKPLAIKIMLSSEDEAARQRFLQEAKLASLVHHPNIVDIADFGVLDSGQPYLVMELLVGKTLADVIDAGPVAPDRASNIAAQIARGLHAVHQKGIIHR